MDAEQIDTLVFMTEQFRSELDQLYHDFPAISTGSASPADFPSINKMKPMLVRMRIIADALRKTRPIFDTLVPEQQASISKLLKTVAGFTGEMKNIHFTIWNADPERAKLEERDINARLEANKQAEESKNAEEDKMVSRDLPSAPTPKVKEEDHPILIRPFLVWAIGDACSASSNEAHLRIMKLDPVMVTWHLMDASFRASPGDIQVVCMTPANLALMPQRWGGCISTNASSQKGVTRSAAAHVPDFSPAAAAGMTVLAWRWFERGHHEWKDAEGYSIPRLTPLVQEYLDLV
ncbi:hypothetical protein ACHAPQ_011455 [Fusarium lateritium]